MRMIADKKLQCGNCSKGIAKGTEYHKVYNGSTSMARVELYIMQVVPMGSTKDIHVKCFYRLARPLSKMLEEIKQRT